MKGNILEDYFANRRIDENGWLRDEVGSKEGECATPQQGWRLARLGLGHRLLIPRGAARLMNYGFY